MSEQFQSFEEFYPFYLSQHQNRTCKRLHFVGTLLVILTAVFTVWSQKWWLFLTLPVIGYSFAWAGHFFFEKNRPATFTYFRYSLLADFVMFKDILVGNIRS
jgi:hypothetical protein